MRAVSEEQIGPPVVVGVQDKDATRSSRREKALTLLSRLKNEPPDVGGDDEIRAPIVGVEKQVGFHGDDQARMAVASKVGCSGGRCAFAQWRTEGTALSELAHALVEEQLTRRVKVREEEVSVVVAIEVGKDEIAGLSQADKQASFVSLIGEGAVAVVAQEGIGLAGDFVGQREACLLGRV